LSAAEKRDYAVFGVARQLLFFQHFFSEAPNLVQLLDFVGVSAGSEL
jgi:hypothetical protein